MYYLTANNRIYNGSKDNIVISDDKEILEDIADDSRSRIRAKSPNPLRLLVSGDFIMTAYKDKYKVAELLNTPYGQRLFHKGKVPVYGGGYVEFKRITFIEKKNELTNKRKIYKIGENN